ncbi:hypothetical protein PTKIN_Ptkin11bG0031600 [Pterospermum kingtungense]
MGILSDVQFLVKGFFDDDYICPLSNPNFLPKQNLVLPEPVSNFHQFTVACCNGLLLLDDYNGNCLLWNPSSAEHKLLPSSSLDNVRPSGKGKADRFFYCSGFGFDSKSQDYKVVRFLKNYFEDDFPVEHQVELYSLNSESWKPISYDHQSSPFYEVFVYIDGVQYWVAYDCSQMGFILSFDFADEKFSSFQMPDDCYVWGKHLLHLMELDGSLALVIYPFKGSLRPFDVWVWNGESWSKILATQPLPCPELLLGFLKNGEQIFVQGSDHQLLLYDGVSKELKDFGICDENPATMQVVPYVETSVQLSAINKNKESSSMTCIKNKE